MSEKTISATKPRGKVAVFLTKNKYILLSAVVALAITQLIYFCYDLFPYGNMTILRMDLYHQYGPLFAELYDRITSGESLIYSWNSGLGSSFLGNFFNYLSSPLSIIILFFGHKNIPEAIAALIAIKAVLSAGTFTYYLKKSINKHDCLSAAFGVLYAFCGYFVAYYWNLMWLDAMVLFPLVILGIEHIIKKGKPGLYCIALVLTFISNYYMAYMVCIFSVLYFLTYYFANYPLNHKFNPVCDKKESLFKKLSNSVFFRSGVKFAFFSVVAALIAAFAILPLMSILTSSSATSDGTPTEYKKYFAVFDFLANHLSATDPTIRSSGNDVLPNVYCGILTVLLVPLFLFSKKIKTREKVSYVALLATLFMSFNINYLNFFWHGFHFPNDLPYRFSFMYSFILLIIAFKALIHLKEYSGKQIMACGIGLIAFLILAEKITSKNVDDISLGLSLVFAIDYVFILGLLNNKKFQTSAVAVLMLCAVTSEIALSNTNKYSMNQSKSNYANDYDTFTELKNTLDEADGGFYRMELTNLRTRMDPSWYDYNGISVFSSMAYEKVANLQQNIGMFGNYINSYTYNPQTAVYNAMFGLKYLVDNNDYNLSDSIYSRMMTKGKFTAYKNNYSLPIAFAVNADTADWSSADAGNPFEAQQQWFYYATDVNNVLNRLTLTASDYENLSAFSDDELSGGTLQYQKLFSDGSASFTAEIAIEETQNVYLYVKSSSTDSATVSSSKTSKTFSTSDGYIVDLGEIPAGDTVYVDVPLKSSAAESGSITFYAYGLNKENFEEGYAKLADDGQLAITSYSDTHIAGTLTAQANEIVYTSIPYDTNWKVYVDGVQIPNKDLINLSEALLSFNISAGTHEIVLEYSSQSLIIGSIITICTLVLATLIIIFKRRRLLLWKNARENKWDLLDKPAANEDFIDVPDSEFVVHIEDDGPTPKADLDGESSSEENG